MRTHPVTAAAIFATLTLLAGPALSMDRAKTVEQESVSMNRRICIKSGIETGTILRAPVCRTRAEWIARTGTDPLAKKQR